MPNLETRDKLCNKLISLWAIQDSLLQAYRSLYSTVNSILFSLSVGILALDPTSHHLFGIPIAWLGIFIGGMGIIFIWQSYVLTKRRANNVSFLQMQLITCEEQGRIYLYRITQNDSIEEGFRELNPDMEYYVVTTFKNFETTSDAGQEKILNTLRTEIKSPNNDQDSARKTLQSSYLMALGFLWAILLIVFLLKLLFKGS